MSATLTPPQQPPRPMVPPAAAGATQGMPTPQNPLQMKLQAVVHGGAEIVKAMASMPGVDRAKLQQAAQMLQQGFTLLVGSVPKGGAAPGAPPPPAGQPPPR